MSTSSFVQRLVAAPTAAALLFAFFVSVHAQSSAALHGRVVDPTGAVVVGVKITMRNQATSAERFAQTDSRGNYRISALPVGAYCVEVQAVGFETQVVEKLSIEVGRIAVRNFQLKVGDVSQQVTVISNASLIDQESISVGQVTGQRAVQGLPLNGRFVLDLGLLIPGSVTPPQNGFSAAPIRGLGALAINTAGNREETVNYMINGITLNNLAFSSISFQPSISTIQEFKINNSTFSAEYGQSSGAVVSIATRSGANEFHGELFEFLRNDALDARNFFNFTSSEPPPFKRNQFGGSLGGPIAKSNTFFFFSYEGLRQRQEVSLNSLVLSDAERNSITDSVIARLIQFVPPANFIDEQGAPRFIGTAKAPINVDQWTIDVSHHLTENDRLHGYYATQRVENREPTQAGATTPGFGHTFQVRRQIFTLNETRAAGSSLVNEARFGFNRIYGVALPATQLNPADFGIRNGVNRSIGLPQLSVAGALNFGGPANQPVGRGDSTWVVADTLNYLAGAHSLKFGGEFRQFLNNNFAQNTGRFNFPSVSAFLMGMANSFSVTLGERTSSIAQGALGLFVQDNYKLRPGLTLELGLRYEWNMTPAERYDRFIIFDPATVSLLRVGQDIDRVYHQNNKNFQPRVGFAWDPFNDGKTSVRGAYAIMVDQPMTSVVMGASANPPLATPLNVTGPVRLDNAINLADDAGLAPMTVDHGFDNAYSQSWNLNAQRALTPDLALMAGYFGSKGTHLIIRRNINQRINGVRPYPALSMSSPILPGEELNNITQVESTGASSYNALWVSAIQRLSRGLQFSASYTWSKSLDYNSLSSQGIVVQNSYNLRGDRGLSDFDARHRFVVNAIYELPFSGNQLIEGWQFAAILQTQSGNPVNIVTGDTEVNGVANTLRPDVTGPIKIIGSVERWFDISVFAPVKRFGNLGRNVIIGPGFNNTDFSIIKNTKFGESIRMQFRAEIFDLFNHANFGQPAPVIGSASFGRITNTRFPTGESGSSRQVQFALKFNF